MSYVAAGVAVAGVATQVYGAQQAGRAAKNAANAQQGAADEWSKFVRGQEQDALSKIQTPQQLAAYDTALHGQEANVRRMETLAQNMDPALVEAGKQTTQLLQGHAAPVLGQIQAQRDLQRKQMLEQLRTQVGPGAETSSIGQQAMQQFDMQTANMMNEVQQQYLDKVSNLAIGGAGSLGQALNQVHATLSQIQTQSPGAQAADIMAKFTTAESGAQEAKVNAAGGQYADQQIQGQMISNVGNTAMTLGALYAGKSMFDKKPGVTAPVAGATDGELEAASGLGTGSFAANRAAGNPLPSAGGPDFMSVGAAQRAAYPGGSLGGSVRSPGVGIPAMTPMHSSSSLLPFSNNYGQSSYPPQFGFNPNAPFIGSGSSTAGGN